MLACKLHSVMQEAVIKMCSCNCLLVLKVIELLPGVSSLADNFLCYGISCYPVYKNNRDIVMPAAKCSRLPSCTLVIISMAYAGKQDVLLKMNFFRI